MMSSSVGMMTFPVFLGSHKIPWFQSPPNSITFRDFDGTFVDSWPHGNLGADSQIVPRSVDQEIKFPCEVQWIYRWESPNWNVVVVVVVDFRILKWRYVSTICQATFCGDIHLHRPYIGLVYGRYLHFRILKFPLILWMEKLKHSIRYRKTTKTLLPRG